MYICKGILVLNMMDYKFLYPVDTDQFANICERGKVYVDKTALMYDLVWRYEYVFLSRPRRFGKSLLCSTLDAYFRGRRELFEGLKILELEKEWKKYPVLRFDMNILKDLSMEVFPTEKNLASWAGMSPGNNESAGKKSSRTVVKLYPPESAIALAHQ